MINSTLGAMRTMLPFATDTILKTTVLLVLVAIASHLLRRRSAALRHLLWTLCISGLVVIPVLTAVVPFRLRVLPATSHGASPRLGRAIDPAATSVADAAQLTSNEAAPAAPQALAPDVSDAPPDTWRTALDPVTLLLAVWLLGAAILLARFGVALLIVRRIARRARTLTDPMWLAVADRAARVLEVSSPVDFRVSDDVAMPFACGLLKPTVVLPVSSERWSAERREAVLMHEMAHISRGDLAMNTLSHFVRALYWFHPMAWLASYRLRVEGERACDDAVLRAGSLPSDYAEHLLSIVRTVGNTVPTVALAMARRSDFEGRLLAILEPGIPRARLTRMRAAGMAAVFLVAVMPLAAMAPADAATMRETEQSAEQQEPAAQATPAAVSALIETLADANPTVRLAAVNSLGSLQDPRAIAALAKALREDADARVREAAAWALGEIDDHRAAAPLLDALKTERVASVREKIVHSLGEIDDPAAVAGISAAVKDASTKVRREVAWALGELEDQSAVPALIGMIRDDDVDVRRHVAEAFGNLKSLASLDALALLTRDTDAEVRTHAVEALGQLEDQRTLGTLVAALKDANADVRSHAADAIHQIDGLSKAPQQLIDLLRDPVRDVRKNAAHALGSIGDVDAVPALRRATSDVDAEVRHAAAESLSEIGGPEALTALMALLKDPDPEIRKIAAEALGKRH